jgi:MbtH protein
MIRRTALATLMLSLMAGCQGPATPPTAASPSVAPTAAPASAPVPATLVTETGLASGFTPITLGQTVMLSLESASGDVTTGTDLGERGVDRLTLQIDTAGRYRFDLDDENREAHTLQVLDAGAKVLLDDAAGGAEPVLELQPGRYTLVLRHASGDNGQVVFIHERAGTDAREIAIGINRVQGANFRGADLRGANLAGVVFQDCDLTGANLRDADLTGAAVLASRTEGLVTTGARTQGYTVLSWEEREDTTIYEAVVNHEEQYSIWPADRELPLGWNKAGKSGLKPEVLAWIEEVWTDMRPLSLRKKMEEAERLQREQEGLG